MRAAPNLTPVATGLFQFDKQLDSGWSLTMTVLALPDRGLLVYSPVAAGPDLFDQLDALGEVRVLVAPNHYHHLSLPKYRARYPSARVVAGTLALPRLAKQGHLGLKPREEAAALLPPGARFLECAGSKSGEVWLSVDAGGMRTWVVGDAFFHVRGEVRGATGWMLRALRTAPGLRLGRTWRWLHLRDVAAYRDWAWAQLSRESPQRLLVSHGQPLESPELPAQLSALLQAHCGKAATQ